jgi:hypothetical protein
MVNVCLEAGHVCQWKQQQVVMATDGESIQRVTH